MLIGANLEGLGDYAELSLKQLAKKLVVLLALTSAERESELGVHDILFDSQKGFVLLSQNLQKNLVLGSLL